jgi:hypothetical protein
MRVWITCEAQERKMYAKFYSKTLEVTDKRRNLGVDGRDVLKWIKINL